MAILGKGQADFQLKPDTEPITDAPWYKIKSFSEVNKYLSIIDEEAAAAKIDPDFVKAVVYLETTQGWYDRFHPENKSIRPMNIQSEYWKDLGYSRTELETPRLNIRAGVDLIKRIQSNYPDGSHSEVATLYNDLAAKKVNDYGARVQILVREKPWLEKK